MKIRKPWTIPRCVALVTATIAIAGMFYRLHRNDLGLTGFDVVMGSRPEMDMLRANTQLAADSFLAQHKNELADDSTDYEFAVDYSKASRIQSLGYTSSFYYYCWDIYLPYSVHTPSGETSNLVVHLSDATPGNHHDPQRFRVIEVILLDHQGRVAKKISGT